MLVYKDLEACSPCLLSLPLTELPQSLLLNFSSCWSPLNSLQHHVQKATPSSKGRSQQDPKQLVDFHIKWIVSQPLNIS